MEHRRLRYEPGRDGALEDFLFNAGVEFPCGGTSLCGRCRIRVVSGDVPATAEMREVLSDPELRAGWRLACRAGARAAVELEVAQWSQQILTDETGVPFEPRPGIGAVVDVGTTTLVAQQVDLASGEVTKVVTALNEQACHGADLMTRIDYELRHPGKLQGIIRAQVRALVSDMCPLEEILLVGNTCMHHLFCGLSVEPLAAVPFRSLHLGAHALPAAVAGSLAATCLPASLPPACSIRLGPAPCSTWERMGRLRWAAATASCARQPPRDRPSRGGASHKGCGRGMARSTASRCGTGTSSATSSAAAARVVCAAAGSSTS
jgi:ferredoxin